jgi:hypothetical protein
VIQRKLSGPCNHQCNKGKQVKESQFQNWKSVFGDESVESKYDQKINKPMSVPYFHSFVKIFILNNSFIIQKEPYTENNQTKLKRARLIYLPFKK